MNPVVPLAKLSGAQLTLPDEAYQTVYTSSGSSLPLETSRLLYERVWSYAQAAIDYSTNQSIAIPPEWSVYDFCLSRIHEDSELDTKTKALATQMLELLTTFTAVDVRNQSLRHYRVEATLPVRSFLALAKSREKVLS
jgi:hypothetical protein